MNTHFYKRVVREITAAGCKYVRPNNGHDIYRNPQTRQMLTVPRKLDDPMLAREIAKRGGVKQFKL